MQAAARSLGYVVSSLASSLASGRTRDIGVVVPLLDRWFFSTVLSGVSSALMRAGYDITLYNITADTDVRRHVFDTFLRRQRVAARARDDRPPSVARRRTPPHRHPTAVVPTRLRPSRAQPDRPG